MGDKPRDFLGHDAPQYEISVDFLYNTKLWCHAKNFAALTMMVDNKDKIHFFSHDSDHHILTSRGIIWAYVGKEIDENTFLECQHNMRVTKADKCYAACLINDSRFYFKEIQRDKDIIEKIVEAEKAFFNTCISKEY